MSAWQRTVTLAALAAASLPAATAAAQKPAQPAQQAEKLNEEGKRLFADRDYEGAYGKFHEAATLSPEGRFFFNVCYALNFLQRYDEAIQACEQVEPAGADAALVAKTRKALASLREKAAGRGKVTPAAAAGVGVQEPPAGEAPPAGPPARPRPGRPGRVEGGGGPTPPPPAAPDPFLAAAARPAGSYKWALGGSIGGLANINTGRRGDYEGREIYDKAGADLRLWANFIVSERARLGVQASLGFGGIAPADEEDVDNNLILADIGGAVFLHLPLGSRLFVTPLIGPALSVQQPNELSQGFIAFGTRAELGLSFVFGRGGEHAVSLTPALNVYFPASGDVEGRDPSEFGLDVTHSTFGIALGYTYRFATPFGTVPIITLE
ncbi:MAG TPA: hypothetical protein VKB80_36240 [Kofleriaceae bacterium]|nr:hypothetical protein [Kofleriaceae bacterium]